MMDMAWGAELWTDRSGGESGALASKPFKLRIDGALSAVFFAKSAPAHASDSRVGEKELRH